MNMWLLYFILREFYVIYLDEEHFAQRLHVKKSFLLEENINKFILIWLKQRVKCRIGLKLNDKLVFTGLFNFPFSSS